MGLGTIASMGTASKAGTLGAKAVTASGATAGAESCIRSSCSAICGISFSWCFYFKQTI